MGGGRITSYNVCYTKLLRATRKGKNGKASEIAPRVLTPADVEARRRRLKTLIVLGKERGYLTFAEINDHLPDDVSYNFV